MSLRLPAIRSSLPGLEGISPKAVGPRHSSLPSWQSGLLRSLKGREAIIYVEKQTGCPKAGTRPAPSSANSPRAARQMDKGSQGGW